MTFARVALIGLLSCACGGGGGGDRTDGEEPPVGEPPAEDPPEEAAIDAGLDEPSPAEDAAPPPAPPPTEEEPPPEPPPPPPEPPPDPTWSDVDKCNAMCGAYCSKRYFCDGTPADACRAAIDADNGGPCEGRGHTFADIPQEQVQSCIAALQNMSCADFLSMFNTGAGIPGPCQGILN
jgi:hypothetical protein